jgi:2-desacetyl-2-hydroxyethyl bacteriochlorophyllide A dehydrogenase
MLAVRKTAPAHGLTLAEVPRPEPGPGEVLVEVEACGICGSDVHVYEWTAGYEWMEPLMPMTVGHEFAGTVVAAAPDVASPAVGQRVTVWPSASCGTCAACREGQPENCERKVTIGLTRQGAFANYVTAPATQCFALPDAIDAELASLTEPLCVSARAVETGEVKLGHTVVVLGAGMIGLGIALMARMAGASRVIVVGKDDPVRLACARDLGFDAVVDLADEELAPAVTRLAGSKVDRVFEATGVAASIRDGLSILRRGGIMVLAGIHARPVEINLTDLVRAKHQLRGSHGSTRQTWATVLKLLERSGELFRPLISHRVGLSETVEGFRLSLSKEASKVVVFPNRPMETAR